MPVILPVRERRYLAFKDAISGLEPSKKNELIRNILNDLSKQQDKSFRCAITIKDFFNGANINTVELHLKAFMDGSKPFDETFMVPDSQDVILDRLVTHMKTNQAVLLRDLLQNNLQIA
jgi:hypothetical protein